MNGPTVPEDYDLILAIQSGDTAAFGMLYRKYWRRLFGFAHQATRSTDDAKDLIQDLFAEMWQNRAALRPDVFTVTYLYTALRYKLLDRIRRQSVRDDYVRRVAESTRGVDDSTEAGILASDFRQHLYRELADLPDRCRLIFQLSRFDHLSTDEIAEQLQLSPQTVKNQLSKALLRLRAQLPEYALSLLLLGLSTLR